MSSYFISLGENQLIVEYFQFEKLTSVWGSGHHKTHFEFMLLYCVYICKIKQELFSNFTFNVKENIK